LSFRGVREGDFLSFLKQAARFAFNLKALLLIPAWFRKQQSRNGFISQVPGVLPGGWLSIPLMRD
jgi:hypothetical protein